MIKVLKFGGTSVGCAENMRKVAAIIDSEQSTITVLSAMSGVTDTLVKISRAAQEGNIHQVEELNNILRVKYTQCIDQLLVASTNKAILKLEESLNLIVIQAANFHPYTSERLIISQGELLTTAIFTMFMQESGLRTELLNAPDFMIADNQGQVDTNLLHNRLCELKLDPHIRYITQGFICTNTDGQIDNLGRGGSDFSAALIGAAIEAGQVQIWTDIDGMHNNDPRVVANTHPIRHMNFDEAAELAYFGAKILHPATIQPCKDHNIPVLLRNTMDPKAEGTKISNEENHSGDFRAVAAKDDITVIHITSLRMLMAYGFLRKIFEVFEQYKTPIDMITTSEVAVSITIDNNAHIAEIEAELHDFGSIRIEHNNSIVCIVGQCGQERQGMAARIFNSLSGIPMKMISYGASHRSIAILIDTKHKHATLQQLNDGLFA